MRLGVVYGDRIKDQFVVDELEGAFGSIALTFTRQHTADGLHSHITGLSLTLSGSAELGGDLTLEGNVLAAVDANGALVQGSSVEIGVIDTLSGSGASAGIKFGDNAGLPGWALITERNAGDQFLNVVDTFQSTDQVMARFAYFGSAYSFEPSSTVAASLGRASSGFRWSNVHALGATILGDGSASGVWQVGSLRANRSTEVDLGAPAISLTGDLAMYGSTGVNLLLLHDDTAGSEDGWAFQEDNSATQLRFVEYNAGASNIRARFLTGGALALNRTAAVTLGTPRLNVGGNVALHATGGVNLLLLYDDTAASEDGWNLVSDNGGEFRFQQYVAGTGTIRARFLSSGHLVTEEFTTDPTLVASSQWAMYAKNNRFVLAYNDAGTTRYYYLDGPSASGTWTHTTSAP